MPPKRTYSRHNLSIAKGNLDPSDTSKGDDNTSKRRKPTPPSPGSPMPQSHELNGGNRPRGIKQNARNAKSLLDNSKKRFSGPTTLPTDEMETDDTDPKKDPFEAALAMAQLKSATKHSRFSIYGGGRVVIDSISAQLKNRKREEKKEAVRTYVADNSSVDLGTRLPSDGIPEVLDLTADAMDHSVASSDEILVEASMRGGSGLTAAEASARIFQGREYLAAQTPPPRRTLWGDKIHRTSSEAITWSSNQTHCPLLRLPASVRRTIFEYALGGNSIELSYTTYKVVPAPNGEDQCVPHFRYTSAVFPTRRDRSQSIETYPKPPFTQGMTLLNRTCRQLYHETYTLPYSLNDFYFPSSNALFNFVVQENRLQPQQCRCITSIVVLHSLPGPAVLEKLENLEHVRLMCPDVPHQVGKYNVVRGVKGAELVRLQPVVKLRGGGAGAGVGGFGGRARYSASGMVGSGDKKGQDHRGLGTGSKFSWK